MGLVAQFGKLLVACLDERWKITFFDGTTLEKGELEGRRSREVREGS
jgi:hypothetical protein